MNKLYILLHVLNILVGSLCVAILGLTTYGIVVKERVDDLIPSSVKPIGIDLLMWAGCGGIVDMVLLLCLISAKSFRRNEVGQPCRYVMEPDRAQLVTVSTLYWNIVLFVATFIFLRPLVILSYTYAENNDSLTPERWACEVGAGSDARSLCDSLRAARYLLIPALVLSAGLPTLVLLSRFRKHTAQ